MLYYVPGTRYRGGSDGKREYQTFVRRFPCYFDAKATNFSPDNWALRIIRAWMEVGVVVGIRVMVRVRLGGGLSSKQKESKTNCGFQIWAKPVAPEPSAPYLSPCRFHCSLHTCLRVGCLALIRYISLCVGFRLCSTIRSYCYLIFPAGPNVGWVVLLYVILNRPRACLHNTGS